MRKNGIFHPSDRLIVPGDDQRSVIVNRTAARNGYTRMPPLGSNTIDTEGVQLLTEWINGPLTSRQDYTAWRESNFGSPPNGGEPGVDDDLDGRTNREEFLTGTDPNKPDPAPDLALSTSGNNLEVTLPPLPGRGVSLLVSDDLVDWEKWDAAGNNGLPRDAANPVGFSIPATREKEFFRAAFEER